MSRENSEWGAFRIHGELLMLGFGVTQSTVSKYMVRDGSPSQSWRRNARSELEVRVRAMCHMRARGREQRAVLFRDPDANPNQPSGKPSTGFIRAHPTER
jgi:hypothetical protein